MISVDALEKIEKYFTESSDAIVAAYVFGSSAAGRERRKSDIDIAIMARGPVGSFERVQMETKLANLLGKDVDLVIFGRASPLLRHQILKYGRIVYEGDARERVSQEVMARWEYLDSLRLYRILGEDTSHGG